MTDRKILNISIIIPTLNEEKTIGKTLTALADFPSLEIIVADGGSVDRTVEKIKKRQLQVVSCPPGRGTQMNCGADKASAETLLFLHSDTSLPNDFQDQIEIILSQPETVAGAFQLAINDPAKIYRLIEWGANFRAAKLQLIYGDQALFVKRNIFFKTGGFPEQTLLEDVILIKKLKKLGRIIIAPSAVSTSSRRWKNLGVFQTTVMNQLILTGYLVGISPKKLAHWYYRQKL